MKQRLLLEHRYLVRNHQENLLRGIGTDANPALPNNWLSLQDGARRQGLALTMCHLQSWIYDFETLEEYFRMAKKADIPSTRSWRPFDEHPKVKALLPCLLETLRTFPEERGFDLLPQRERDSLLNIQQHSLLRYDKLMQAYPGHGTPGIPSAPKVPCRIFHPRIPSWWLWRTNAIFLILTARQDMAHELSEQTRVPSWPFTLVGSGCASKCASEYASACASECPSERGSECPREWEREHGEVREESEGAHVDEESVTEEGGDTQEEEEAQSDVEVGDERFERAQYHGWTADLQRLFEKQQRRRLMLPCPLQEQMMIQPEGIQMVDWKVLRKAKETPTVPCQGREHRRYPADCPSPSHHGCPSVDRNEAHTRWMDCDCTSVQMDKLDVHWFASSLNEKKGTNVMWFHPAAMEEANIDVEWFECVSVDTTEVHLTWFDCLSIEQKEMDINWFSSSMQIEAEKEESDASWCDCASVPDDDARTEGWTWSDCASNDNNEGDTSGPAQEGNMEAFAIPEVRAPASESSALRTHCRHPVRGLLLERRPWRWCVQREDEEEEGNAEPTSSPSLPSCPLTWRPPPRLLTPASAFRRKPRSRLLIDLTFRLQRLLRGAKGQSARTHTKSCSRLQTAGSGWSWGFLREFTQSLSRRVDSSVPNPLTTGISKRGRQCVSEKGRISSLDPLKTSSQLYHKATHNLLPVISPKNTSRAKKSLRRDKTGSAKARS
uniref:Uncharacterized protein n=1 Tax=Chromera velia CCMP2878 TaxID=1169474 RepID=A0A0G4I2M3_9ALVE|eukprot:Cvel_10369.t1-p1 / transcript=Cvel_10369.t1 / gene=Cvel_10369 / organism=Chromera_velia_CCMP2878 / gene_product=hypothetical protein / transcript_product=hypothetical protein / location=Cvel_scaffold624:48293-51592(-) / protein_length=721 / sequence_SO=supercontig / SO=protein_coding / is_pseudo=false